MTKKKQITPPDLESVNSAEAQIAEVGKRIDFYTVEYTIELLANKMRDDEYVVPGYQREYIWEEARKHRFIESLLMGLPVPFLFFWERDDGRLEIVDGSQRLRTIHEFVYGGLRLGPLDRLPKLDGHAFSDLLPSRQRKFQNRSVRGIVLNDDADTVSRLDMFDRINTGSKKAEPAEIRRGAAAGPFMDLVLELANSDAFVDLAPVTGAQGQKREREELVARFFAYGDGLEGYKDRPADFVLAYSRAANELFENDPSKKAEFLQDFNNVMDFVKRTFRLGFAKSPTSKTSPRARFESIAIGSRLALRERPDLAVPMELVDQWVTGEEFSAIAGSDGANARARLEARIEFVRSRLIP
jgi:Protein of unknown function DUF262